MCIHMAMVLVACVAAAICEMDFIECESKGNSS